MWQRPDAVAMTVVAQGVNDLPTCKRPAGANVATTGPGGDDRRCAGRERLAQGGRALPRLGAGAPEGVHRNGGDEQTAPMPVPLR